MVQNQYVGDIGDYARSALLRALSKDRRMGVAWYLYPNEKEKGDGRHIDYLKRPEVWKCLDPELFDGLKRIVESDSRCVAEFEASDLLPGAEFAGECLYTDIPPQDWAKLRAWRARWFDNVMAKLSGCDIVFADPDNGLCLDEKYSASRRKNWKRLPLSEAQELAKHPDGRKRAAIIYHHNSRFLGGTRAEIEYWMGKLPAGTYAYWCRSYSPRTFFVVNPDEDVVAGLERFKEGWEQVELRRKIRPNKRSKLIKPIK